MRMLWIILAFLLGASAAFQAQTWETSWEAFAKAIAPYAARSDNNAGPEMAAQFNGKSVVWEGTVSKEAKYVDDDFLPFDMEMTPQTFRIPDAKPAGRVEVKAIRVELKKGSLAAWNQVPVGTKVKFRAVLRMPLYVTLGLADKTEVIFSVRDGEPVLRGQ